LGEHSAEQSDFPWHRLYSVGPVGAHQSAKARKVHLRQV